MNGDPPRSREEDLPGGNEESGLAGTSEDAELAGEAQLLGPVVRAERISSVDALRGIALLGILLMNIVGFGLPHQAYTFPNVAGGDTGLNLAVWAINSVLFEGSMRAIFSMLFGAGMLLLTSRLEARKGTGEVADIYYRRTLWLLAFGVVHGYLFLWYGDILYGYAAVGLFLYPFRKMSPRGLITIGVLLLLVLVPKSIHARQSMEAKHEAAMEADAAAERSETLTEEQEDAQQAWREIYEEQRPSEEVIQEQIDERRSGYWTNFTGMVPMNVDVQSTFFYLWIFWDIAGMMFIGIGMMKLGIFSASRSTRFYITMAALGYAIALPIRVYLAYDAVVYDFEVIRYPSLNWTLYDVGRSFVALGHVGVIMLICKKGLAAWLISRLAAVGQMALTNYVMHSIICAFIFYGFGFGLFGRLERFELYYIVFGIWLFQLLASPVWLRHFRFGPLEWLWRSLTYWKPQPMKAQ